MRALPALSLCLGLLACTEIPEVSGSVPRGLEDAEYPTLIPLEMIGTSDDGVDEVDTETALNARVYALRARAAALRNRQIDD